MIKLVFHTLSIAHILFQAENYYQSVFILHLLVNYILPSGISGWAEGKWNCERRIASHRQHIKQYKHCSTWIRAKASLKHSTSAAQKRGQSQLRA